MRFAGWVPTVTGRMSFSRVGADYGSHNADVCNRAKESHGVIFGVARRSSKDAPLPAPLMRLIGRISGAHFLTFLRTDRDFLPVPSDNPTQPDWKLDEKGQLTGTVIVAVGSWRDTPSVSAFARGLRSRIRTASDAKLTSSAVQQQAAAAEQAIADHWDQLLAAFAANPARAPAFARATVSLKRTGVCHIDVSVDDLYNSEPVLTLRQAGRTPDEIARSPAGQAAAAQVARHVFFFLRDLAHRHYHHTPHSDLATTIYPASAIDDETWRRETQYSLVRMAISARRENNIASYRRAAGIIAYAEAFQHHLAMWKEVSPQTAAECGQVFPYDFAALRASMDASLAGRESDLGMKREMVAYSVGTFLAVLGAILGSGQIWKADERTAACTGAHCALQKNFWNLTSQIVDHPWYWLVSSIVLAVFVLVTTRGLFAGSWWNRGVRGGVSRALDATMGSLSVWLRSRLLAWMATAALGGGILYLLFRAGRWTLNETVAYWTMLLASYSGASL